MYTFLPRCVILFPFLSASEFNLYQYHPRKIPSSGMQSGSIAVAMVQRQVMVVQGTVASISIASCIGLLTASLSASFPLA